VNDIGRARRGAVVAIIVSGLQIGAGVAVAADSGKHLSKLDVWVMDADGTDPTNLTNTTGVIEEHPDWAPD
jgi:hypothetical protein